MCMSFFLIPSFQRCACPFFLIFFFFFLFSYWLRTSCHIKYSAGVGAWRNRLAIAISYLVPTSSSPGRFFSRGEWEKKSRDLTGRVANSRVPIARARGLYYGSRWRLAPSLLPYRIVPSLRDSFLCSQKRFFEVVC